MKKVLFIFILLIGFVQVQSQNRKRPNVLFIAIDDLNTSPEPFKGETTVFTPNISSLAKKGMLFTNAHCAAPACNPSRTSVMTGVAPATSGVYENAQDWRKNSLFKDWITLPEHFSNNGYTTKGGGKLYHAASLSQKGYTGYMDAEPWDEYFPSKDRQMPNEVLPPEKRAVHSSTKFYGGRFDWAALDIEPDDMADAKVVSWAETQLSQKHDKPLFLAVGIYRPHIPWYTPKEYYNRNPLDKLVMPEVRANDLDDVPEAGKENLKTNWHQWILDNGQYENFVRGYYASVSFTDDMVGRLISALEKGPLAGNTVVILWSDHGYHLGQKQHWEKFALWEQTTRVPFIIASPGKFKIGKECKQAVSLLDIYPTLNELCGIKSNQKFDGVSLVPLLKNPKQKTGRAIVTTQGKGNHAVRSENWRYIRYSNGSEELYNQQKDPKNFDNLAGQEKYKPIIEDLTQWLPKNNAANNPLGMETYTKKKGKK